MLHVRTLPLGPIQTNAYALFPEKSDEAWLVDAPEGALAALRALPEMRGRTLAGVLLTHGHWDHMQGLSELQEAGAKVYAHRDSATLIGNPADVQSVFMFPGMQVRGAKIDVEAVDGQTISVGGTPCRVLEVPGHCPGSLAFYFPEGACVFSGDALFAGSVGRTDFPGGNWNILQQSITSKLYALPERTVVYPGHGAATGVGDEKRANPFVRV